MATPKFYNEMGEPGNVRLPYKDIIEWLDRADSKPIKQKQREAEDLFRQTGITFAVYGQKAQTERLIPFDIMPRVFSLEEWQKI